MDRNVTVRLWTGVLQRGYAWSGRGGRVQHQQQRPWRHWSLKWAALHPEKERREKREEAAAAPHETPDFGVLLCFKTKLLKLPAPRCLHPEVHTYKNNGRPCSTVDLLNSALFRAITLNLKSLEGWVQKHLGENREKKACLNVKTRLLKLQREFRQQRQCLWRWTALEMLLIGMYFCFYFCECC